MRKETLLRIMELLRMNLDRGLTILEISKKLKIGYRPAYNHVIQMYEERIIILKKAGRANQSFLNLKSEKGRHLLGEVDMIRKEKLYQKELKLRSVLEKLIRKLIEKHISGIQSTVLFGSYAKGKAVRGSDVDILFIVSDMKDDKLRADIERECAVFQYSHSVRISPVITNADEFRRMLISEGLNIGKEVRESGLVLYGSELFWRLLA